MLQNTKENSSFQLADQEECSVICDEYSAMQLLSPSGSLELRPPRMIIMYTDNLSSVEGFLLYPTASQENHRNGDKIAAIFFVP